jgi:hypothetical protein
MGANLPDLPDELLLTILSSVHPLKNVSLVSKRLCGISACAAVWRTRDHPSHRAIREAIRTLRCLDTWTRTQHLVANLCAHIRVQFVQDVRDRKTDDVLQLLESLGNLPENATVPEYDFLIIIEAILGWILIATNIGIRNWFLPIMALKLLSRLPPSARISEEQSSNLLRIVRGQIIQDIGNSRHYFSSIMLRDLSSLTQKIEMPDDFFFGIVESIHDSANQCIQNGQTEDAKATLKILHYLPKNTHIPNNFFFRVVETIRGHFEWTISHGLYDTMKLLCILDALPSTTRVPDNYFSSVVAHFWSRLLQDIKNGTGFDAIRILRMLRQLPLNTTIPKTQFLAVEMMVRNQITRNLSSGRARGAERMIQVLRNLSSIEHYAFRHDRERLE